MPCGNSIARLNEPNEEENLSQHQSNDKPTFSAPWSGEEDASAAGGADEGTDVLSKSSKAPKQKSHFLEVVPHTITFRKGRYKQRTTIMHGSQDKPLNHFVLTNYTPIEIMSCERSHTNTIMAIRWKWINAGL